MFPMRSLIKTEREAPDTTFEETQTRKLAVQHYRQTHRTSTTQFFLAGSVPFSCLAPLLATQNSELKRNEWL